MAEPLIWGIDLFVELVGSGSAYVLTRQKRKWSHRFMWLH